MNRLGQKLKLNRWLRGVFSLSPAEGLFIFLVCLMFLFLSCSSTFPTQQVGARSSLKLMMNESCKYFLHMVLVGIVVNARLNC